MQRRSFRDRVRFERPVTSKDAGGGSTGSWTELTTEWCDIERIQSFRFDVERKVGGSQSSMPLVRIHVHDSTLTRQIDNSMRGVDVRTNKTFEIDFVQDLDGQGRRLVISASEGAPV